MKVGLVLGAGGLMGVAWLTGALQALAEETEWDPACADYVVGTSAGSLIGSLLVSGRYPAAIEGGLGGGAARREGTSADGSEGGDSAREASPPWPPRQLGSLPIYRLHRGLPRPGPGSWRLTLSTLMRPDRRTPVTVYSSLLPQGVFSTHPIKEAIREFVPSGWSSHPNLWVVACDYATGRRVPFGRSDAPAADLPDAVAASCAIPGFYHPVRIGGRRYVDGGMYSTSNLDVIREYGLDLAICLNPTSTLHPVRAWNPLEQVANTWRRESGRRLGRETRTLRARGTEVVLVQPTDLDLAVIGPNLMSRRRHTEVIETARRTTAEQLRRPEVAERLAGLPRGTAVAAGPAAGARREAAGGSG